MCGLKQEGIQGGYGYIAGLPTLPLLAFCGCFPNHFMEDDDLIDQQLEDIRTTTTLSFYKVFFCKTRT